MRLASISFHTALAVALYHEHFGTLTALYDGSASPLCRWNCACAPRMLYVKFSTYFRHMAFGITSAIRRSRRRAKALSG